MSSIDMTGPHPVVDGALALKEELKKIAPERKGPVLVPPICTLEEASKPESAKQFFIDLHNSLHAEQPIVLVAKEPADPYETRCGQCGDSMIFRTPIKEWVKAFCPTCRESVWVR